MRTLIAPLEIAYSRKVVCYFLMYWEFMDYSSIVRVWKGQLIVYHFNESEIELLSCNLETRACEFLKT